MAVCTFFAKKEITLRKKLSATVVLLVLLLSFTIQGFDQIWHMGQRPVGFYFRNSWVANAFMLVLASESLMQWKDGFRLNEFLVAIFRFWYDFIVVDCYELFICRNLTENTRIYYLDDRLMCILL